MKSAERRRQEIWAGLCAGPSKLEARRLRADAAVELEVEFGKACKHRAAIGDMRLLIETGLLRF